jgi:hypothetical protein
MNHAISQLEIADQESNFSDDSGCRGFQNQLPDPAKDLSPFLETMWTERNNGARIEEPYLFAGLLLVKS